MTFDREAKGITFGLLALLAIVGNYGLIDWFLASREISISIWLAVLAAMLAFVPEIVVLGKVTESGDWIPGLAAGTLGLLVILFLFILCHRPLCLYVLRGPVMVRRRRRNPYLVAIDTRIRSNYPVLFLCECPSR